MTVIELLAALRDARIDVIVDAGRLRVRAPEGALTSALHSEIAAHKPELLRLLAGSRDLSPTTAIPRRSRAGALPASFAQQRLWILHQLEPANPAYNLRGAVRLTG